MEVIPIADKTLEQYIKDHYPEALKQWDEWNYQLYCPLSLSDTAKIMVNLINEDKTIIQLEISLGEIAKLTT